jgi:hypothetical protein
MPVNRIDDFVFDLFCSYEFLVIDGNEIIYRDYVDISVAVAAPKVINKMNEISENKMIYSIGFGCTGASKC